MIYKLYAIKDTKVGFMPPFIQVNDGVAVREFKNIVNDKSGVVAINYSDMELYCLGLINLDNGEISDNSPKFIINGSSVKDVAENV